MSETLIRCDRSEAEAALAGCVPGASVIPDRLFEAAEKAGHIVRFKRIEDVEVLSKEQLFDTVVSDGEAFRTKVFIIADCLLPKSAFLYEGASLRQAVLAEKEFLFDGDVLFVWPDSRFVAVFHHEGGYFHVRA